MSSVQFNWHGDTSAKSQGTDMSTTNRMRRGDSDVQYPDFPFRRTRAGRTDHHHQTRHTNHDDENLGDHQDGYHPDRDGGGAERTRQLSMKRPVESATLAVPTPDASAFDAVGPVDYLDWGYFGEDFSIPDGIRASGGSARGQQHIQEEANGHEEHEADEDEDNDDDDDDEQEEEEVDDLTMVELTPGALARYRRLSGLVTKPKPATDPLRQRTRLVAKTVAIASPEGDTDGRTRKRNGGGYSVDDRDDGSQAGSRTTTPTDVRMDTDEDFFLPASPVPSTTPIRPPGPEDRLGTIPVPTAVPTGRTRPGMSTRREPQLQNVQPQQQQRSQNNSARMSLSVLPPNSALREPPRRIATTPAAGRATPRIGSPLKNIVTFSSSPVMSTPSGVGDGSSIGIGRSSGGGPGSRTTATRMGSLLGRRGFGDSTSPLAMPPIRPSKGKSRVEPGSGSRPTSKSGIDSRSGPGSNAVTPPALSGLSLAVNGRSSLSFSLASPEGDGVDQYDDNEIEDDAGGVDIRGDTSGVVLHRSLLASTRPAKQANGRTGEQDDDVFYPSLHQAVRQSIQTDRTNGWAKEQSNATTADAGREQDYNRDGRPVPDVVPAATTVPAPRRPGRRQSLAELVGQARSHTHAQPHISSQPPSGRGKERASPSPPTSPSPSPPRSRSQPGRPSESSSHPAVALPVQAPTRRTSLTNLPLRPASSSNLDFRTSQLTRPNPGAGLKSATSATSATSGKSDGSSGSMVTHHPRSPHRASLFPSPRVRARSVTGNQTGLGARRVRSVLGNMRSTSTAESVAGSTAGIAGTPAMDGPVTSETTTGPGQTTGIRVHPALESAAAPDPVSRSRPTTTSSVATSGVSVPVRGRADGDAPGRDGQRGSKKRVAEFEDDDGYQMSDGRAESRANGSRPTKRPTVTSDGSDVWMDILPDPQHQSKQADTEPDYPDDQADEEDGEDGSEKTAVDDEDVDFTADDSFFSSYLSSTRLSESEAEEDEPESPTDVRDDDSRYAYSRADQTGYTDSRVDETGYTDSSVGETGYTDSRVDETGFTSRADQTGYTDSRYDDSRFDEDTQYEESHLVSRVPLKPGDGDSFLSADGDSGADNSEIPAVPVDSKSSGSGFLSTLSSAVSSFLPSFFTRSASTAPRPKNNKTKHKTDHPLLTQLPPLSRKSGWTPQHSAVLDALYLFSRSEQSNPTTSMMDCELVENKAVIDRYPIVKTVENIKLARWGYIVNMRPVHILVCALFMDLLLDDDNDGQSIIGQTPICRITARTVVVRLMSVMIARQRRREADRGIVRPIQDIHSGAFSPPGPKSDVWLDLRRLGVWMESQHGGRL